MFRAERQDWAWPRGASEAGLGQGLRARNSGPWTLTAEESRSKKWLESKNRVGNEALPWSSKFLPGWIPALVARWPWVRGGFPGHAAGSALRHLGYAPGCPLRAVASDCPAEECWPLITCHK